MCALDDKGVAVPAASDSGGGRTGAGVGVEQRPRFTGIKVGEVLTPQWNMFGHLLAKGPKPMPTLFTFGVDYLNNLAREDFNKLGFLLLSHGWQSVSLDGPCYGFDLKAGEQEGLPGWRARLEVGQDLMGAFTAKATQLLEHLVREGYTDPQRVVAAGSSRGAFQALHWAAAEARVRAVVAFSPAVDMSVVSEYAGMKNFQAVQALALEHQIDRLSDRAIWACLGNADERVNTDCCLSFMRRLMNAATKRKGDQSADVEFRLSAMMGHATYPMAHEDAAAWLLAQAAKWDTAC